MFSPYEVAVRRHNVAGFDGWFDAVKKTVASVVPSHTVVGKWASGNTSGAIAAAGSLAAGALTSKPPASQPTPAVMSMGPEPVFKLGGVGISTTTLLLGGGALVAALVLLRRRRR